nr:variable surface lipoprotein [Mycoplasmopsis bovis]
MASIPFVAAKCGETKEEKKPEADKPADNTPGKIIKKDNVNQLTQIKVQKPKKTWLIKIKKTKKNLKKIKSKILKLRFKN